MDDRRMFLIHLAYALEILIAYIMFVFALPRKKKFPLRAAAGFSVFFVAVLFVPEELFGLYLYISLNTVCVLAVIILGTKFLFKVSWKVAIFLRDRRRFGAAYGLSDVAAVDDAVYPNAVSVG